jgi:hypothetical protein
MMESARAKLGGNGKPAHGSNAIERTDNSSSDRRNAARDVMNSSNSDDTPLPPTSRNRKELVWYFNQGSETRGPVSAEELARLIRTDVLSGSDWVWKEGMPEWIEVRAMDKNSL